VVAAAREVSEPVGACGVSKDATDRIGPGDDDHIGQWAPVASLRTIPDEVKRVGTVRRLSEECGRRQEDGDLKGAAEPEASHASRVRMDGSA